MASDFPQLLVLNGEEEGLEYTLPTQGKVRIGRAEDNDLVLKDNSVSRHHVHIQVEGKSVLIRDGGSSNGTILAGKTLKANQEIPLRHNDEIQIGIYQLRYLENPFSEDQFEGKPKKETDSSKANEDKAENAEAQAILDEIPEVNRKTHQVVSQNWNDRLKEIFKLEVFKQKPKWIWWILGVGSVLVVLLLLWNAQQTKKSKIAPWNDAEFEESLKEPLVKPEVKAEQVQSPQIQAEESKPDVQANTTQTEQSQIPAVTESQTATEVIPLSQAIPTENSINTNESQAGHVTVFLDIESKPFAATLYMGDERLGRAPLRKNVTLKVGEPIEVHADYELPDVKDVYRETKIVTPKVTDDVLTVRFDAKLAEINVIKLPRRADFFLRGFYEYDTSQSFPVNLTRISYGRPLYLPFGHYHLELREDTHVSGSSNLVSKITYQREYMLNEDNRKLEISISDEDLKKFPVTIKSIPDGATIYRNLEKVGVTPFVGFLPIGPNPLKIRKDGFFEQELSVDMSMNSIYETLVELKTSKMGEFILQAKERQHLDQTDEAIQLLIEALKYGGSDSEKAEVYYMLGSAYFQKNEFETAQSYFGRSELTLEWQERSKLAIAQVLHKQGQTPKAIAKIAEVMVALDENSPLEIKQEANSVFKRVSPVQSAIYIYTDPGDANVFVNDKLIEQTSPVLLSGLGLGNYRIRIEKNGYEIYNAKQNLKISEFSVVKVKLEKKEL